MLHLNNLNFLYFTPETENNFLISIIVTFRLTLNLSIFFFCTKDSYSFKNPFNVCFSIPSGKSIQNKLKLRRLKIYLNKFTKTFIFFSPDKKTYFFFFWIIKSLEFYIYNRMLKQQSNILSPIFKLMTPLREIHFPSTQLNLSDLLKKKKIHFKH